MSKGSVSLAAAVRLRKFDRPGTKIGVDNYIVGDVASKDHCPRRYAEGTYDIRW